MKHLFIVGVGRSGTSLLQSMLAAHPRIAMLPETGFLRRYVFSGDLKPFDSSQLREDDYRLRRIRQSCWELAAPPGTKQTTLAIYRALHQPSCGECLNTAVNSETAVVGDKDPRLVEYLPVLPYVFQNDIYVINIVRDQRDVLLSKIKAGWSEKRNWRVNLAASRIQLGLADIDGARLFADRWITVRYEDLIETPEGVLTRITSALEIEYCADMLHFSRAARDLTGEKVEEWKKETLGPLLSHNTNKWRAGLSRGQIAAVEGATKRWLRRFDYGLLYGMKARRVMYGLVFSLIFFLYRLYRWMRIGRTVRNLKRVA